MSKRNIEFYIVDIFLIIFKIQVYTKNFNNGEELLNSMLEWDATIRELEIIGEAVNTLIKLDILENKKYRKIVDFRNLIIHGYFGIDEDEVWNVVTDKLIPLKNELKSLILGKNLFIHNAIKYAQEENMKNRQIIEFLNTIESELIL